VRSGSASEAKLFRGDVDAQNVEALGQTPRLSSVTAPEVEHAGAVVQPRRQLIENCSEGSPSMLPIHAPNRGTSAS
jgi:hypothetical protein